MPKTENPMDRIKPLIEIAHKYIDGCTNYSYDDIFMMDGDEHYVGNPDACSCSAFGKTCGCGGFMHYQPTYGGFYYQCEKCKECQ